MRSHLSPNGFVSIVTLSVYHSPLVNLAQIQVSGALALDRLAAAGGDQKGSPEIGPAPLLTRHRASGEALRSAPRSGKNRSSVMPPLSAPHASSHQAGWWSAHPPRDAGTSRRRSHDRGVRVARARLPMTETTRTRR